jgi:hypothetical protein
MTIPEFKAILKTVSAETKMSDKANSGTKQTVLVEIPGRKISDEWGVERDVKPEHFELDVINKKIDPVFLASLVGKKVVIKTAYLNGYDFIDEKSVTKYGKSLTLAKIEEFK